MQDDNLFAYSTVNETLMFAASLRLPSSMSLEDKQGHVDTVIGKLGLTPARDVIIGGPKARGVSGGERKRVTIGVELLHNPPLVFLDEPTSGLDSFQAQSVMETLQNLASNGHTVVCSIHQPRSSIYAMVDSLMLLAGGRCAYYGPSGSLCHSYFAGLSHPVPEDFNPADHLLDVISVDYRTKEQEGDSKARVDTIVQSWQTSGSGAILSHREEAAAAAGKHVDQESHALALQPETAHMMQTQTIEYAEKHGGRGASCCTAFPLLLTRTWRELTRNKTELALQIFMNMFFSALFGKQACLFVARARVRARVGSICLSSSRSTLFSRCVFGCLAAAGIIYLRMPFSQKSIMDRTGLLFFQAMNGAFGSAINTSTAIPTQLQVVNRERTAGMYSIFPFCESDLETLPRTGCIRLFSICVVRVRLCLKLVAVQTPLHLLH